MQSGKIYKNQGVRKGGTFTLTTDKNGLPLDGTLTNEANVNFDVPEGQSRYLTAGNDVIDLSKWDGTKSVNIGDAFSGDNDKVTVMANGLAGTGANNLKLTSIENLEIVNSGVKTSVALDGANFKGLEAVKLIGDATILNVSDFTQGVKIDATANADYIIGSDKADTINGGAGNDTIEGKDGDDVLTGGNGADTFVVGTVKAAGVDQILDFSAEDKISFVGGTYRVKELKKFDASTFSTVTYKTLDSVLATFGSGGANETKDGDVVIFSYDGKTYALLATDTGFKEANDALVDITGANVASLTESNFGEAISLYTYENYAAFKSNANNIPAGEAIIKTMEVNDAKELALDNDLLAKVANGGIKAITAGTIEINMSTITGASIFDARTFDAKLGADVVTDDVKMNINGLNVTNGNDTIFASELGGTITGGSGADVITAGASKDTFVQTKTSSVDPTGMTLGTTNIETGNTLTFGNGVDIIKGFDGSGGDVIKGGSSTITAALGKAKADGFTADNTYYLSGNFVANTFTVTADGVGKDTLVFIAKETSLSNNTDLSGAVVLVGVNSGDLSNNNFEAA